MKPGQLVMRTNVTENSGRSGKIEKKVIIPWERYRLFLEVSVEINRSICFPAGTTVFSYKW